MNASPYDNLTAEDLDRIRRRIRIAPDSPISFDDAVALLAEVYRLRLSLALVRDMYADVIGVLGSALVTDRSCFGMSTLSDESIAYRLTPEAAAVLDQADGAHR